MKNYNDIIEKRKKTQLYKKKEGCEAIRLTGKTMTNRGPIG